MGTPTHLRIAATYRFGGVGMSATSSELRIVELLPGGDRITSRPLRIVAALDDRGEILVHFRNLATPEDLVHVLGAAIASTAVATGIPATMLGSAAGQAAEDALRRRGHHG